jgi:uncharacterized protein with HEPN domain
VSAERDLRYLEDMVECVRRVAEIVGEGQAAFAASWRSQDALIRNLELIGEAAKSLSPAFRAGNADLPWREMGRFRDLAIHHYFDVRLDIVWSIAEQSVPPLQRRLPALIAAAGQDARPDATARGAERLAASAPNEEPPAPGSDRPRQR